MPIIGFTDTITPRFPRLGKLRKGGEMIEKDGKKIVGPDLDHFRFASDREEITSAFQAVYGDAPRNIQVYIPYATPSEAFSTWCEVWGSSGLIHRCDGKNMFIWLEGDKYIKGSKPCMGGHEKDDPLNDAIGRLDMIIPELIEAGYVGYVTLETHSKHDILGILSVLEKVYETRIDNPLGLRGILFNLRRTQEAISVPGWGKREGKRSQSDKWLVRIEPAADWVRLQLGMAHAAQMEGIGQLPAGNPPAEPEKQDIFDGETGELIGKATQPIKQEQPPANGGNGKKQPPQPQPNLNGEIDLLGALLWPGLWEQKKKTIIDAFTNGGNYDINGALAFVRKRMGDIAKPEGFTQHISKSWPGYERFISAIVKEQGKEFNILHAIEGIAAAAVAKGNNPDLDDQNLEDVIYSYLLPVTQPDL